MVGVVCGQSFAISFASKKITQSVPCQRARYVGSLYAAAECAVFTQDGK